MNTIDEKFIESLYQDLTPVTRNRVDDTVSKIVKIKEKGQKVVVMMGSGPNIHEGVTTLVSELIKKQIIDGVITSSAVIAHEMAGSLDRVKRVNGIELGINSGILPRGDVFEITLMDEDTLKKIQEEMIIDNELIKKALTMPGNPIIKAAGNMAYPMGLRTEKLAVEVELISKITGKPFEYIAGLGADNRTMIGAGAQNNVPVIVSVPQLVGGGMVGLCIADSIPIKERSKALANLLESATLIIESAAALTQEIHDGPFETYTGHGIWSAWTGIKTYSLKNKSIVRIDLDPNLEKAWEAEKKSRAVQEAVDRGLPKTKMLKVPFRMEMSGFARLEDSIPVVGDIGVIWPIIALKVSKALNVQLDFISYPQESEPGKEMREWIVKEVKILDRNLMIEKATGGKTYAAEISKLIET